MPRGAKKALREKRPCARVLRVTKSAGAAAVRLTLMGPVFGSGSASHAASCGERRLGSNVAGDAKREGLEARTSPFEALTTEALRKQSDAVAAHPAAVSSCDQGTHAGERVPLDAQNQERAAGPGGSDTECAAFETGLTSPVRTLMNSRMTRAWMACIGLSFRT